jgi:DNA polymerase I-like protein with 3'-5' exonuclease and polymerase domains
MTYYNITNVDEIIKNLTGDYVGIDIETNGLDPRKADILSVAISNGKSTYTFAVNKARDALVCALCKLNDSGVYLVAHHAKFDFAFLWEHFNFRPVRPFCTMLASQILNNGLKKKHNLIDVLRRYTGVTLMETSKKKYMRHLYIESTSNSTITIPMLDYVAEDTTYLPRLAMEQVRLGKSAGLSRVIDLENALLIPLLSMERNGCLIDVDGWKTEIPNWIKKRDAYQTALDKELKELSEAFPQLKTPFYIGERYSLEITQFDLFGQDELIGWETKRISYASQAQILNMIKVMGLPIPMEEGRDKEVKESVEANVITVYLNQYNDSPLRQFFSLLLKYREFYKLVSTYGESFLGKLDEDNHIRTSYTQCRTKTGRLSSEKPNLQNIPTLSSGNTERKDIREFFIARPGYKLITCDMNSAEVAIATDYSKDPFLLKANKEGLDYHSLLASVTFSTIFGEPVAVSDSEESVIIKGETYKLGKLRKSHKGVLFGKFYKAGAKTIFKQLSKYIYKHVAPEKHIKIARKISEDFDAMVPKLTKYLTNLINEANRKKVLVGSKLGRKRYFPETAYAEACNFPIQNTNAEAMKLAIISFFKWLTANPDIDASLCMTVHDELVVEVREDQSELVAQKVKSELSHWLSYFLEEVKGGASVTILDHWQK